MRRDTHIPVHCGSGDAHPPHQAIVELPERDALSLLGGGLLGGNLFAGPHRRPGAGQPWPTTPGRGPDPAREQCAGPGRRPIAPRWAVARPDQQTPVSLG